MADVPNRSPGLVLIIDDEAAVREAVGEVFALVGVPTIMAENGREGLSFFQERRDEIRLIILDLSMPGIGGEATLRELQRIGVDVPVILSSGYSDTPILDRAADGGAIEFLRKPYGIETLLSLATRYLGSADVEQHNF